MKIGYFFWGGRGGGNTVDIYPDPDIKASTHAQMWSFDRKGTAASLLPASWQR